MPILPADQDSAIAGVDAGGIYRWASMIEDADNAGAGILKVFTGGVPDVSGEGALATEFKGTYDDYENEITDISTGSPDLLFSISTGGRTVAIKRVVAQFEVADVANVFQVVVERTVGATTVQFILFAMTEVSTKKNFFVEGHALIRPEETVKVIYDGPSANDLWYSVTTLEV